MMDTFHYLVSRKQKGITELYNILSWEGPARIIESNSHWSKSRIVVHGLIDLNENAFLLCFIYKECPEAVYSIRIAESFQNKFLKDKKFKPFLWT